MNKCYYCKKDINEVELFLVNDNKCDVEFIHKECIPTEDGVLDSDGNMLKHGDIVYLYGYIQSVFVVTGKHIGFISKEHMIIIDTEDEDIINLSINTELVEFTEFKDYLFNENRKGPLKLIERGEGIEGEEMLLVQ